MIVDLIRNDLSRIGSHIFSAKELPEGAGAKAKVGYIYLPTFYRTVTGPKENHHTTTADVERILGDFSAQGVGVAQAQQRTLEHAQRLLGGECT